MPINLIFDLVGVLADFGTRKCFEKFIALNGCLIEKATNYEAENSYESGKKDPFAQYSEPVVMNDAVVVLQYTVSQEPETAEDDVSMIPYNMNQLDDVSANTAIMRSSKLKNDFINTYFI